MRINTGSGIDPKMVDQLIEIEKQPIKNIDVRKKTVQDEKKLFSDLRGLVTTLGTNSTSFRSMTDFSKLKLTSSNPEILEGTAENTAPTGTYEIEVLQLARKQKLLTQSFPDKDETPVGFGYMTIETDTDSFDIDVDPDHSTLQDIVAQINSAAKGVRATVLNTKESLEDPDEENFRLLVINEKSGKQAEVFIDPDTTYLEFEEDGIPGKNLEMNFEDVKVYNETNKVTDLIKGMTLNAKKAAPGTTVYVTVDYDIEKTMEGIKTFVESYNKVNEFLEKQFKVDQESGHAGPLAKENNLRTLRRALQGAAQVSVPNNKKFQSLADVGISTDPKTGGLKYDDAKLKKSLTDNYEEVAHLFVQSENSMGIGARISDAVRSSSDPQNGVFPSKEREYKKILDAFDKDIATKQRYVDQRSEGIKRKFSALEQFVSKFNTQSQAMQAQLGSG